MTTLTTRLRGLAALAGIIAIVAGLPLLLVAAGTSPLADVQTLATHIGDLLLSPDDGTLALIVIRLAAWVAWALMTLSLLIEAVSQVSGARTPRLPGFKMPQGVARTLIGTAMLAFIAAPAANAMPATAAPAAVVAEQPVTVVSAPVDPAQAKPVVDEQREDHDAAPVTRYTTRSGDTLWELAETYLGDGKRFKEIAELNRGVLGDKPGFLSVGVVLSIPDERQAHQGTGAADQEQEAKDVVVQRGDTLSQIAADELGDPGRYPELFDASKGIEQPGGAHLTDPNVILPGWTVHVPGTEPVSHDVEQAPAAPAQERPQTPPAADQNQPADAAPEALEAPYEAATPSGDVADDALAPQTRAEQDAAPAPAPVAPTAPATTQQATPATQPVQVPPAAQNQAAEQDQTAQVDDGLGEVVPWQTVTATGVSTILAAGVIAMVARRRRDQQRLRRPGQTMPMPQGEAAAFEQEIRAADGERERQVVDAALRTLAQHSAQTSQPLPTVRAGRLTQTEFELYLEEPATLPAPWTSQGDNTVWVLDVTNDLPTPAVPAPYPSLVTLGHDDDNAHVFLNLEHLGALGITGDDTRTRQILAALAVELATSIWADDLQVTLVGAFPELEDALRTGRIRYLPTIGRLVDELTTSAARDRATLAAHGAPDLNAARPAGIAPDSWNPEIIILAGPTTPRQHEQITDLVTELPHVALATVTSGISVGEWNLTLATGQDLALLAPIDLPIVPQRLTDPAYGHLLEVVSLADVEELAHDEPTDDIQTPDQTQPVTLRVVHTNDDTTEPPTRAGSSTSFVLAPVDPSQIRYDDETDDEAPEPITQTTAEVPPTDTPRSAIVEPPADDATDETDQEVTMPDNTTPRILVLGAVDIENAEGPVENSRRSRLLELAAYLVLHPKATAAAIDAAIWPERPSDDNFNTRNTATSKLRRWLGKDPAGEDYLPKNPAGGYAFTSAVTTDIARWDDLLRGDPLSASTENLTAALALVRGVPFEGAHRRRYAWAETIRQRLISEIVDASYTLSKRHLMGGRWRAAEAAVVIGLGIEPAQECLWRIRILAAHESRNPQAEAEAIDRLLTFTQELECDLEPETEQLLDALKTGAGFDQLAHAL